MSATNISTTSATLNWVPAPVNNNNTGFQVAYWLANTSNNWTSLNSITASSINVSGLLPGTQYQWRVKKLCTSLNSTEVFDVFTTLGAPCNAPTTLSSSATTSSQATVSWAVVSGAVSYSVQYKAASSSTWSASINSTATNLTLTGLSATTLYDWRVMTNCSANASSFVAAQFTTLIPPCNAPTGISTTNIMATQATVNWPAVSAAVSYNVQYKAASSNTWSTAVSTTATNRTITGLTASTLCDWRVMTNCSSNVSGYVIAQFTTGTGSCSVPTGLVANYITNTNALIEWAAVNNANSYRLQYKTAATSWTVVQNINANLYTLSNLDMNTVYQVAISTKCGSTFTAYSPVVSFTTLNCVTSANNTAQWIDLFKVGTINRVSGADAGGYVNTGLSTNLVIGSTANAGQISAGFAGAAASNNYNVYIDFNRNGSFNESNERVFGAALISTAGTYNFTFSIPSTATPGVTGMRVVMRKNTDGPPMPYLQGFVGEAEDYLVNLTTSAFQGFGGNPVTVSEMKTLTGELITNSGITFAPNPSTGKFSVSFNSGFNPIQYDILTTSGLAVKSAKVVSAKTLQLDITAMPAGLYLLRLTDRSGRKELLRLIKE